LTFDRAETKEFIRSSWYLQAGKLDISPKRLIKIKTSPRDGCGIKEDGEGAVCYNGTTPFAHARNGTLRLCLDLLFDIHPPAGLTELVVTSETEYLLGRWLVIADPTNEA
jgi:hypothetical protein